MSQGGHEREQALESHTFLAPTEQDIVDEIERLDEEQIIASMKGHIIEKLFYEIDVRGAKQVALSWAGVKWFTLQQKSITVEEVKLDETPDSYRAWAWARDKIRDVRVLGAAEQRKMMRVKDGTTIPDEYALAKVVSKAQRNALRNLIPETMISEALRGWKEGRKPVEPVEARPEPKTILPKVGLGPQRLDV